MAIQFEREGYQIYYVLSIYYLIFYVTYLVLSCSLISMRIVHSIIRISGRNIRKWTTFRLFRLEMITVAIIMAIIDPSNHRGVNTTGQSANNNNIQ